MADLIQSHKGICSLNEENCEISLLVFDTVFFHSCNTLKESCNIPLQFDKFFDSSFNEIKEYFWNATHCNLTSFYHHLECRTIMRHYPSLCMPGVLPIVMPAGMWGCYCCCMYVVCNCWREEAAKRSPVHTRRHVHCYTNCCVVLTRMSRIGFE